jgi:hypothetical protein
VRRDVEREKFQNRLQLPGLLISERAASALLKFAALATPSINSDLFIRFFHLVKLIYFLPEGRTATQVSTLLAIVADERTLL